MSGRFPLHGLVAVLLALMAQLGIGATVPKIDTIAAAAVLCHTDDTGHAPSHTPGHWPADCPLCPLCGVTHTSLATLVPVATPLAPQAIAVVFKAELPPPATAPPALHWPPSQPRAPPTLS